jgi:hypothetical protein
LKIFVCRLDDGDGSESKVTEKVTEEDETHVITSASIPHLLRDLRAWHTVLSATPARVG